MTAYYNEFDPKAAAWLRQLIKNGDIAPGEVDERSIIDVSADDLAGFTQHHFFAGVGVWSYALRSAGWSDDSPVCTASLPCQPFSSAGRHKGKDDERHLLPHFLDLVSQCGFNTIFGEQVESAIRHGWLDDLHTEMEAQGYAVGHAVLGAHSAGGFHQRQRLYWVAESVADTNIFKLQGQREMARPSHSEANKDWQEHRVINDSSRGSLGNTSQQGLQKHGGFGKLHIRQSNGPDSYGLNIDTSVSDTTDIEWVYCRDEKYRAVKSGLEPLVDGSTEGVGYSGDPSQPIDADYSAEARVMRLKGYGNAIHAGTAQMFIEAFAESI